MKIIQEKKGKHYNVVLHANSQILKEKKTVETHDRLRPEDDIITLFFKVVLIFFFLYYLQCISSICSSNSDVGILPESVRQQMLPNFHHFSQYLLLLELMHLHIRIRCLVIIAILKRPLSCSATSLLLHNLRSPQAEFEFLMHPIIPQAFLAVHDNHCFYF